MLADDGALILKFWLHLPKKQQKQRLKKLERDGRLAPDDWEHFKSYERFIKISAHTLRHTDKLLAPWHIVEATDRRYRELTVAEILTSALERRLTPATPPAPAPAVAPRARPSKHDSILAAVDLSQRLASTVYEHELDRLQAKLTKLSWRAQRKGISTVLAFEGWDAAGKGSAIRRVTEALDPRLYRVVGVAAPTDEERAQHYLWRFWRHLPRAGCVAIFDRTWYGRVLVERIEGFARPAEWAGAYGEINAFEEQLAAHGIVLCKFWLHISPQEQLRRFKDRQRVAFKRYKITDEDWRNRDKWPDYQEAVDEMVARCSTEFAPWTLVAGNDKKFARIQILRTIVERLAAAL
jgi:polyphosphate:AMP phosphotransferase